MDLNVKYNKKSLQQTFRISNILWTSWSLKSITLIGLLLKMPAIQTFWLDLKDRLRQNSETTNQIRRVKEVEVVDLDAVSQPQPEAQTQAQAQTSPPESRSFNKTICTRRLKVCLYLCFRDRFFYVGVGRLLSRVMMGNNVLSSRSEMNKTNEIFKQELRENQYNSTSKRLH